MSRDIDFMKGCRVGADSVLNELYNAIAELEESRSDTSYGNGQRYILRELISRMDIKMPNILERKARR